MLFFRHNALFAQVISNNGAAISVTSGIVINAKDASNISGGILSNNGTFNLTGNYTSTATTSGNGTFRIGGNWTNTGGIFVPGTSTVIFNGSDNQSIIRSGGETYYNLSIENSGASTSKSVELANNVTVTGTLSMQLGNVNAASYRLLLSNPAVSSLNYTSVTGSRIFGKFERGINETGNYLFPLGTSAYYNPANLITNSVSSSGTVLSEFLTSPPPGDAGLPIPDPPVEVAKAYPDGYWSLTANGFSSGNLSISLNGSGFTDTIFDITRVIKRTAGGNWMIDGVHSDAVGSVVFRNNLTGDISPAGTQFALGRSRPLITVHPASQIVCERTNPVFSVTATGANPLRYIWYKEPGIIIMNGPHYSGARTANLTIINAVLSDAGNYYCIVRDRYGNSTTSSSATLTVNKIPVATATPSSQDHECSGIAFTDIVLGESYGVPGTTYIWSRTNPSGIISSVPLSGTGLNIGDILSGSFTNTTDVPIAITFSIIPVGPNPTYCVGSALPATVTVNPTPRVIPVNTKPAICYGGSTEITLTTPTVMTMPDAIRFDYTVSITGAPGVIIGDTIDRNDLIPGQKLAFSYQNISDTIQSVYYTITPKDVVLGCTSGPVVIPEVKIHARPLPGHQPWKVLLPPASSIDVTKPLTCSGGAGLASLRAVISKGADPYKIIWDGPVGYHMEDSVDITNLSSGKYVVKVTDMLGCFRKDSISIVPVTARAYISAEIILPGNYNVSCIGSSDGVILVSVTGGITPPYNYWIVRNDRDTLYSGIFTNNMNLLDPTTYRYYSNLPAASYTLIIRDINGCEDRKRIVFRVPPLMVVTFGKSQYQGGFNISCKGYNDGSAWVQTITGGRGNYKYRWYTFNGNIPGPVNTNRIDGITAGLYYLETKDTLNCIKIDSVLITEPDGMQLSDYQLSRSPDGSFNISCNGGNDGFIKLTIVGGSGTYIYQWTGPNGFTATTKDISGLTVGTYVASVRDLNGCVLIPQPAFTLTQPTLLDVAIVKSLSTDGSFNINCNGGTGSINLTVTGGSVGTYKYNWSTANGSGLITGQEDQYVLTAGAYHVVVTDSNLCVAQKDISLNQPQSITTALTPSDITCLSAGFNDGSIDLTVTGGVSPFLFNWSTGATTEDVDGLTQGSYKVTVTDVNGCQRADSDKINLPPPIAYSDTSSFYNGYSISCNGLSDGWIRITTSGGEEPFVFSWSGPDGFFSSNQNISGLIAGQYSLLIRDNNSCTATGLFTLTEPGKLDMSVVLSTSFTGGYNINCAGDSTGSITVNAINSVGTPDYLWSDGITSATRNNLPAGIYQIIVMDQNSCVADSTINLTEPDTIGLSFDIIQAFCPDSPNGEIRLTATGGEAGTDYSYKWSDNSTSRNITDVFSGLYWVTVTDANNCSHRDSVIMEPLNETCLIIPNAISPNGDNINDIWNIGMIYLYPQIEIKIFNRWGELLWKSEKGYPQPWDGRSKGADLPVDSYHYIIELHNGSKPYVGNVTIVR